MTGIRCSYGLAPACREAASFNRHDVFAQTGRSDLSLQRVRAVPFLSATEFDWCLRQASAVVAHAGMGTILKALEVEKPILVLPRRARFAETRNDHQLDTVRRLSELRAVRAA